MCRNYRTYILHQFISTVKKPRKSAVSSDKEEDTPKKILGNYLGLGTELSISGVSVKKSRAEV